ncbi:hypothetical protein U1Q18_025520 [Sarracenia purpurea var. burkii]
MLGGFVYRGWRFLKGDEKPGCAQSCCWGLCAFFGIGPAVGSLFLLLVVVPHQHRIITEGCGNDAGRFLCDG